MSGDEAIAAPAPRGTPLRFRGGRYVVFVPLAAMAASVLYLSLNHASIQALWIAFGGALLFGLILARDGRAYVETALRGLSNPLFGLISLAIILASVIGAILEAGGLVTAIAHYTVRSEMTGSAFTALVFVVTALIGVSTGSAGATLLTAGPILYPIGYLVGADPALLVGAIVSGGAFGDNMAPLGNTSIVSAYTQDAEVGEVVKSRLKYAIPCAVITTLLFYLLPAEQPVIGVAAQAAEPAARSLVMLLAPLAVVVLAIRRCHLLIALSIGIAVGLVAGLTTGLFRPSDVLAITGEFESDGMILKGIENSLDIVVAGMFLFPLVNVLIEGGVNDLVLEHTDRFITGVRSAEASIVGLILALGVVTATDTLSIIVAGPVAKRIGLQYGIARNRRANLMDCASITISFVLPYGIAALLGSYISQRFAPVPNPVIVSPLSAGMHMIYCWVMLAIVIVAVATGYGRSLASDDRDDLVHSHDRRP